MAWTELTRRQHDRSGNRYASDLTDAEWALIAPLMPPRKTTGRPRTTDLRAVFDVIVHVATTGCQWRMLPNDFPAVSTVRGCFYAWRNDGLLDEMNHKLVAATRLAEGRNAQPTAGIVDSQSVKTTESGGVRGYGETCGRHRSEAHGEREADQGAQAPHRHRHGGIAGGS